jgi:hypothetical protein
MSLLALLARLQPEWTDARPIFSTSRSPKSREFLHGQFAYLLNRSRPGPPEQESICRTENRPAPAGCTRCRWPRGGERVCQWNSCTVAPSAQRIRQQIEEGFDNIDVIDDEIRGIVDWPRSQG